MKKIVSVAEVDGEGLMAFLGERVLLLCANYFYEGKLAGVNDTCVLLEDAYLVYETGAWDKPGYSDRQKLSGKGWYVKTAAIESFGASK